MLTNKEDDAGRGGDLRGAAGTGEVAGRTPRKASCWDAAKVGIACRFHRNWALLPRVGAACLDWAPLFSIVLSDVAYYAGSIHDSRR